MNFKNKHFFICILYSINAAGLDTNDETKNIENQLDSIQFSLINNDKN